MINDIDFGILKTNFFEIDKTKKLNSEILHFLYENNFFKLFLNEELGGSEYNLLQVAEIIDKTSFHDGNIGWLTAIGSGGNYFYKYMDKDVSQEIFKGDKSVIAGSAAPTGKAIEIDENTYQINGNWKYNSGSAYATTFTANAKVYDSSDEPQKKIISFAINSKDVQVINDWNTFGLRATSSDTITIESATVDKNHTFNIFSQPRNKSILSFDFPFYQFAQVTFAAVILGLGKRFISESEIILKSNKLKWNISSPRKSGIIEDLINDSKVIIKDYSDKFYSVIEYLSHQSRINSISNSEEKQVSNLCVEINKKVFEVSTRLYRHLGMIAADENSAINKIFRDIGTACHHVMLKSYN